MDSSSSASGPLATGTGAVVGGTGIGGGGIDGGGIDDGPGSVATMPGAVAVKDPVLDDDGDGRRNKSQQSPEQRYPPPLTATASFEQMLIRSGADGGCHSNGTPTCGDDGGPTRTSQDRKSGGIGIGIGVGDGAGSSFLHHGDVHDLGHSNRSPDSVLAPLDVVDDGSDGGGGGGGGSSRFNFSNRSPPSSSSSDARSDTDRPQPRPLPSPRREGGVESDEVGAAAFLPPRPTYPPPAPPPNDDDGDDVEARMDRHPEDGCRGGGEAGGDAGTPIEAPGGATREIEVDGVGNPSPQFAASGEPTPTGVAEATIANATATAGANANAKVKVNGKNSPNDTNANANVGTVGDRDANANANASSARGVSDVRSGPEVDGSPSSGPEPAATAASDDTADHANAVTGAGGIGRGNDGFAGGDGHGHGDGDCRGGESGKDAKKRVDGRDGTATNSTATGGTSTPARKKTSTTVSTGLSPKHESISRSIESRLRSSNATIRSLLHDRSVETDALRNLRKKAARLQMLLLDEAYDCGTRMVQLHHEDVGGIIPDDGAGPTDGEAGDDRGKEQEEGAAGGAVVDVVAKLEREFATVLAAHHHLQSQSHDDSSRPIPSPDDGGLVRVDPVHVATQKKTYIDAKMSSQRLVKQMVFVKDLCHQIVTSLREELRDATSAKNATESQMREQLDALTSERDAALSELGDALTKTCRRIEVLRGTYDRVDGHNAVLREALSNVESSAAKTEVDMVNTLHALADDKNRIEVELKDRIRLAGEGITAVERTMDGMKRRVRGSGLIAAPSLARHLSVGSAGSRGHSRAHSLLSRSSSTGSAYAAASGVDGDGRARAAAAAAAPSVPVEEEEEASNPVVGGDVSWRREVERQLEASIRLLSCGLPIISDDRRSIDVDASSATATAIDHRPLLPATVVEEALNHSLHEILLGGAESSVAASTADNGDNVSPSPEEEEEVEEEKEEGPSLSPLGSSSSSSATTTLGEARGTLLALLSSRSIDAELHRLAAAAAAEGVRDTRAARRGAKVHGLACYQDQRSPHGITGVHFVVGNSHPSGAGGLQRERKSGIPPLPINCSSVSNTNTDTMRFDGNDIPPPFIPPVQDGDDGMAEEENDDDEEKETDDRLSPSSRHKQHHCGSRLRHLEGRRGWEMSRRRREQWQQQRGIGVGIGLVRPTNRMTTHDPRPPNGGSVETAKGGNLWLVEAEAEKAVSLAENGTKSNDGGVAEATTQVGRAPTTDARNRGRFSLLCP